MPGFRPTAGRDCGCARRGSSVEFRESYVAGISATKVECLGRWGKRSSAGRVLGQAEMCAGALARESSAQHSHTGTDTNMIMMKMNMITNMSTPRDRDLAGGGAAPHEHSHGRGLSEIREIIITRESAKPPRRLRSQSLRLLGAARGERFTLPPSRSPLPRKVGAVDAMIDIVCAAVGAEALGVDEIICSSLNVGGRNV